MTEQIKLRESCLGVDQTSEYIFLKESIIRRLNTCECVKYIYKINIKLQEVTAELEADERDHKELRKSIDAALERPIRMPDVSLVERERRELFHETWNKRKSQRPFKFAGKKNIVNFKFYVKNNNGLREKVRRGYLKRVRENIGRKISQERLERFNLNQTLQRFYQNAQDLLKDMLQLRYRARCANYENIECDSNEKSDYLELTPK